MRLPKYSKRGREYQCRWCQAAFGQKEDLDCHLREGKHQVKFYCECCHQMLDFKNFESVDKHFKARHPRRRGVWTNEGGLEKVEESIITRGLKLGQEEMWKNHLEQERVCKMR